MFSDQIWLIINILKHKGLLNDNEISWINSAGEVFGFDAIQLRHSSKEQKSEMFDIMQKIPYEDFKKKQEKNLLCATCNKKVKPVDDGLPFPKFECIKCDKRLELEELIVRKFQV